MNLFRRQVKTVVWVLALIAPSLSQALERETPVVTAVRKVSPAVVNISAEYPVRTRTNPFGTFGANPFLDNFFKDFFEEGQERSQKRASLGSGVIIDGQRGFILTNAHVISHTGTIRATLNDEREFEAQIVGADPDSDLAVLRIEADAPLPAVQMGQSTDLLIGETVIAIGNPFGFSHTVTTGVISAINRSVRTEDRVFQNFIQIDASINPGNSGGPLLNINGELIGINTAIYAKAQGIGFAIPIDRAQKIVADLIQFGEVVPAWIGVTVQDIDPRMAQYLGITQGPGVLVKDVEGPARKAGIGVGDVIMSLGKQPIGSVGLYETALRGVKAGERLSVVVWRGGKQVQLWLETAVFPEEQALDTAFRLMGVRVEPINAASRAKYRVVAKEGVVITELRSGSALARIGAAPGDVIRRIDDHPIKSLADFKKAVSRNYQKPSVVVLIQREDQGYYVTIKQG
jgi:Do/DeqQ family serine protease